MAQVLRATLARVVDTIPISAVQSATIVCEVTEKLERWIRTKHPANVVVPTVEDISITQGGSVWWCRGVAVPASSVIPSLGALLESLLRDASARRRTPAGLLYVTARATDPRHLAPFDTLNDFRVTLARFAALQRPLAVDALLAQYCIARSGLPSLGSESSIADVRRLRRAGGIALQQIAEDTGIPVSLLRELEWGVYVNWQMAHARAALTSYAERAGLDSDAVVQVVAREQTMALLEQPATVSAPAAATPAHVSLPFVFAALLLGTLVVAVPGDRSPAPLAERAIVTAPSAPAQAPVLVPAVRQEVALEPRRQVTPATVQVPRRARRSSTMMGRTPPRTDRDKQHPIVRFARTIAGDGRYRVEPFPKPR